MGRGGARRNILDMFHSNFTLWCSLFHIFGGSRSFFFLMHSFHAVSTAPEGVFCACVGFRCRERHFSIFTVKYRTEILAYLDGVL